MKPEDERALQDYLDDRLSPDARGAFEGRLSSEPELARRLAEERAVGEELRADAPALSPGFYTRARARFEEAAPRRKRRPPLSWEALGLAAAAVLALAIFLPPVLRRAPEVSPAMDRTEALDKNRKAARSNAEDPVTDAPTTVTETLGKRGGALEAVGEEEGGALGGTEILSDPESLREEVGDERSDSTVSGTGAVGDAAPGEPLSQPGRFRQEKAVGGTEADAAPDGPRKAEATEGFAPAGAPLADEESAARAAPEAKKLDAVPPPPSDRDRESRAAEELRDHAASGVPEPAPAEKESEPAETLSQTRQQFAAAPDQALEKDADDDTRQALRATSLVGGPQAVPLPADVVAVGDLRSVVERAEWETLARGPGAEALQPLGPWRTGSRLVLIGAPESGIDCSTLEIVARSTNYLLLFSRPREPRAEHGGCALVLRDDGLELILRELPE